MPRHSESLERLAREDPSLRFRTDEELGVVRHLRGRLAEGGGDDPASEAQRLGIGFLSEHRDLFGEIDPEAVVMLDAGPDPAGGANVTLEQRHAGYRVLGGSIRFHIDDAGTLDTISNRLFPDLAEVPREPRIDAETALRSLYAATKSKAGSKSPPEPVVVRHEGRPYLAWEVRLDIDRTQRGDWGEPTQWVGYVDTESGRVLYMYNDIQTAGPVVANGTGHYSGVGTINAWFTDTTYQLRDTTRTGAGGPEITTNDEDGASPSEDADGNWNTTSTSPRDANQGAEVDAHRFTGAVIDYFRTVHGRVSFDGGGGTHVNLVHVGSNVSNGWWDGTQVNLGDGTGAPPGDDYECSDDWLAHEWTHAYTKYTCGLVYNGESGALNESFSDVFAAFITGDWLVFEDTWLNASAPSWRNMVDPTNGGQWNVADPITSTLAGHQPSHYSVRYTGSWDSGGVHVNSGIINNLFYLLTIGGTHTVSGIAVTGIGQSAAERMLWRCMTVNLVGQPNATFLQFREAMLDACLDLFPTDLFKLAQVKAAFNAVGVGPDVYLRDNLADSGVEPNPAGLLWMSPDIINRTTPVANPTVDLGDLTNGSLAQNVEFGQDNYIYVRLQNRGPQPGDATVRVYFSAATSFSTPGSWIFIGTLTVAGIAPGAVAVLGPLTFPAGQIPAPGHYCLVAVSSSTLDPAPDTNLITSVPMFVDYVKGTNNIAWRNLDVVNDVPPGTVATWELVVRSLGPDVEGYELRLDCARFVPEAGLRVRGPARVLENTKPRRLKLVERGDEEVIFEVAAESRRLPVPDPVAYGWKRVGFEGVTIPDEFTIQVEFELPEDHRLDELGRPGLWAGRLLTVTQLWKGEPVGRAGIVVEPVRG
jgi:bacillolysin